MNNTINTFLHTEAPINHQQQPVQTDTGIFTPKHDGVYFEGFGRDGQPLPEKRICSLLKVVADTRTVQGNGWGILLEWRDSDNREQRWAMPKRLLSDGGAEIAGELLDRGLWIAPNKRNKVLEYITATRTTKRITCTDRTGWHGQAYVTPERVYGLDGDQYIYQAEGVGIDSIMSTTSTLVDWQNAVARYAVGNARLMFAIATAFAGTLVTPANVESGGFHLVGGSSSGKTTAQRAAASVWTKQGVQDFADRIMAGSDDFCEEVQAALAAILETQRRDAELAAWAHMVPPDGGSPTPEECALAETIATAIRTGNHYGKDNSNDR